MRLLHGAAALPALSPSAGALAQPLPAEKLRPERLQVSLAINEASQRPFVKALLGLIGEAAQIDWQLQPVPWARALLMAERGQMMVFGLSRTPERNQRFNFSEPVFDNHVWMVMRRDHAVDYRKLSDLSGHTLCMARGISYGPEFEAAKGSLFKVESADGDLKARVRMLMAGRCDVLLSSHRSSQPWMFERLLREQTGHSAALSVLPTPLQVDPIHFALAKSHPETPVLARLNAAIRQKTREIQALVERDF